MGDEGGGPLRKKRQRKHDACSTTRTMDWQKSFPKGVWKIVMGVKVLTALSQSESDPVWIQRRAEGRGMSNIWKQRVKKENGGRKKGYTTNKGQEMLVTPPVGKGDNRNVLERKIR